MKYTFEICANSVESCLAAQEGGAHRVELCASMPEGGTTPSIGEVKLARRLLDIKLHVIIRPRGGDFVYSPLELDIMEEDIRAVKEAGADGVVFGCLTPEAELDMPAMKRLVEAAEGMSITFHRAFDYVLRPAEVMDSLIWMGVSRILTSGQQPTAIQGTDLLASLVKQAAGRIIIMPGCGVNESNIRDLAEKTGASEFHFSARENKESRMLYRDPALSMGGTVTVDEYLTPVTTAEREVAKHNSVTNFSSPFLYVWMSLPGRYSDVWMLRAKSNFLPFTDSSGSASDCASHPRPVITIGPIKAPAL